MYRYMLEKKLRFCLFAVLLVLCCGGGSLFSLVMSALVDCSGKGMGQLIGALGMGIAYIVIYVGISICYHRMRNRLLADARYSLKRDLFAGIMHKPVMDFEEESSAGYINDLNNNVNLFETVYFSNLIAVLECLAGMGAAAAICIFIQPLMLVLMIFLALLTMGVTRFTSGPLEKATRYFTEKMEAYTAEIKDDFGGFRLIHSFGILPKIQEKHNRANRGVEEAKRKSEDCGIWCAYTGQLTGLLSTVFVMALAAYFSLKGLFSAGMVVAFGHLIGNIVSPVTRIPSIVADFRASRSLQIRFAKLMDHAEAVKSEGEEIKKKEPKRRKGWKEPEEQSVQNEENKATLTEIRRGIRVEQLSFGYRMDREVIRNFSWEFKAGKKYALMGVNGSGKSTLLSLLLGYYPDYRGEINFDDVSLRQLKRDSLGKVMTMVSQETFLFQDTLWNNITLYKENCTSEEIESALEQAGLKSLVESLPEGLFTVISENGRNFSGGEKQKISLARALLQKSSILLLDEFTANLDEKTAREVEERVLKLSDCLVIAVTHRKMQEVLEKYDQIVILGEDCQKPEDIAMCSG